MVDQWVVQCAFDVATTVLGLGLLAVVVVGCLVLVRKRKDIRGPVLAAAAWVVVFMIVPVWCGSYGHHIVLPMVGYGLLLGGIAASLVQRFRWRILEAVLPLFIGLALCLVAWINAREYSTPAYHHFIHIILNGNAFHCPPASAERVGESADLRGRQV